MTTSRSHPLAFVVISALCLALHNLIMITGDFLGLSIWLGLSVSFAIVLTFGYLAHSRFTFAEPLSLSRFARYGLAMLVNLPVSAITVWLFARQMNLPMWMAAPLSTLCSVAFNFALSRWAISQPPQVRKP